MPPTSLYDARMLLRRLLDKHRQTITNSEGILADAVEELLKGLSAFGTVLDYLDGEDLRYVQVVIHCEDTCPSRGKPRRFLVDIWTSTAVLDDEYESSSYSSPRRASSPGMLSPGTPPLPDSDFPLPPPESSAITQPIAPPTPTEGPPLHRGLGQIPVPFSRSTMEFILTSSHSSTSWENILLHAPTVATVPGAIIPAHMVVSPRLDAPKVRM
ncbi:hypothetical protein DXG01_012689, partial [Tephrocybe rancida]